MTTTIEERPRANYARLDELHRAIIPLAQRARARQAEMESDKQNLYALIRQARAEGMPANELAEITGYTRQTIWAIIEGRMGYKKEERIERTAGIGPATNTQEETGREG